VAKETRQRLVDAATEELVLTGDLQITSVARRAGVSAGTPYRHFTGRSDLLVAVLDAFFDRLGTAAAMRHYDAPAFAVRERERLEDWVSALYEDPLSRLVLTGLVGDGHVNAALDAHLARLITFGTANMARAQQAGEMPADRDPELTAAAALGGVLSAVTVALRRTPRLPADELVDQLWRLLTGLLGTASADGVSAAPRRVRAQNRPSLRTPR
jgi:AcrR family transcriptional regulator